MPRKVFVAGEILTASDVNTNLMDQSVMVFDDASARTTAIPTPVEGMVTYLKDTDEVDKFDGSDFVPVGIAPAILQVVSVQKTNTFTTASGSFVDVTDFDVSITPSSTANKLVIAYQAYLGNTSNSGGAVLSFTNAADTVLFSADAAGSRSVGTSGYNFAIANSATNAFAVAGTFVHSPSTTSAFTVKGRLRASQEGTACFGRSGSDSDGATRFRGPGSLVVMEVAG